MSWHEILIFGSFLILVTFLLFLDIGIFNKENKPVTFKSALFWTSVWVSLALIFWGLIYFFGNQIHDPQNIEDLTQLITKYNHPIKIDTDNFDVALMVYQQNLGLEFITGYLIEYSLSVDNIFVILMIFYSFGVEKNYYHKVLFWGILGAIIMRFLFIFLSSALIQQFSWILYGFGLLLVFTGVKMFIERNNVGKIDTTNHPVIRLAGKYLSVDHEYKGDRFFIRKNNKLYITGLFVVLLVIEFTDVIFAVDSIPAIFSVTRDPYIVYFSNIFAIIGLRSLFFLVESIIQRFWFIKIGLSLLLVFIGMKMLIHPFYDIQTMHSLIIVLGILVGSVLISVFFPKKNPVISDQVE
ncbi:MAG: TerC/Alx family metal homeostasis membrane protein [Bacteroidetes bacterium]|nr:TerC/Alx family metal homeostasis membrane protein [Bacteroidota bacterium]